MKFKVDQQVEYYFGDIITKYDFEMVNKSDRAVSLKNSNCLIYVTVERGETIIWFEDLNDISNRFNISSLIKFRKLSKKIKKYSGSNRFKFWSDIIEKFFSDILKGNFSWKDEYYKFEKEMKTLINEVWKLESNHPIYQKFAKNDMSWEDDMRDYLGI